MKTGKTSILGLYGRALLEVRAFWPHLGIVLFLGLLAAPLALLAPVPLKIVVDSVLGGETLPAPLAALMPAAVANAPWANLAAALGLAAAIGVLTLIHRTGEWLFREWVGERMVHAFRSRLLGHGIAVAAGATSPQATQDLAYRINNDAPALQWTALYGFIPVIVSLASLAGTFWVTASINLPLALIALATTVPAMALIHLTQRRMRGKWHGVKQQESTMQAIVQEVLGAVRLVATYGQEAREISRFRAGSWSMVKAKLRTMAAEGALGAAMTLSTAIGGMATLYVGVVEVQSHVLTVGDLLLVIAYTVHLYEPLQAIGSHIAGQQQAIVSAERAFALLDEKPAVADRADAHPLGRAVGDVTFRTVGFAYPGRGNGGAGAVLRNVDLEIPAGICVGIVGPTGAGKSTLVNLLMRLADPDQGSILLDGIDLRDIRLADLRRQFAVVSQDSMLLSMSVADNIAYARPEAPLADVIAAARAANAHDFIMALPDGYATRLGEGGARLSGGERQRIALARAFLKDAPILVLDEPTSALDRDTEAAIVDSLERLMRGRTTFIIAHRLETLRNADRVLRVADGRVTMEPRLVFDETAVAA